METEILELESFLPYRLYRLADAVSREFSGIYKQRHGLTRPEWRTLSGLGQRGTMTATELGEQSAMHKTKVSRAVAELERRRWLTRTPDENDRRVEHLALTKMGLAAYREMVPLAKAFERELLERLSEEEQTAIVNGIAALEACFGQDKVGANHVGLEGFSQEHADGLASKEISRRRTSRARRLQQPL
jgi:DNA-binding MarR family transcriptional regulator